jgi:Domain of unknown function (DUF4160)
MPQICRFYGLIVMMFGDDHNPPHFHVRYGEYEAIFIILTTELYAGYLPKQATRLVKEWGALHKSELMQNWQLLQDGKLAFPIAPLE